MDQNKDNQKKLEIELTPEIAAGTYANFAIVSHTDQEFFIDFAVLGPNMPKTRVNTRIVLTPTNAKRLLNALQENMKHFDNRGKQPTVNPTDAGLTANPFGVGKA